MFNKLFFRKSCRLSDMWKNMVEPDGPDDNMVHALCVLDSWDYS